LSLKNNKDENQSMENEANTTYEEDACALILSTGDATVDVWVLDLGVISCIIM